MPTYATVSPQGRSWRSLGVALVTSIGPALGCGDIDIDCNEFPGAEARVVIGTKDLVWTPYIYRQIGQALCAPGHAVTGISCIGERCEGVSIACRAFPDILASSRWSEAVGSLGPSDISTASCNSDEVMTGVECEDERCSVIRIRCTSTPAVLEGCEATPFTSPVMTWTPCIMGASSRFARQVLARGGDSASLGLGICR